MRGLGLLALLALSGPTLQGCAVLPLTGAAAGVAAIQGGTGAIVKAGTEYRANGVIYRTVATPIDEVHRAAFEALRQLEIEVRDDRIAPNAIRMRARAEDRRVDIQIVRLTPVLTSLRLVVKRGVNGRDRATASEILARVEDVLDRGTATAASPRSCACDR